MQVPRFDGRGLTNQVTGAPVDADKNEALNGASELTAGLGGILHCLPPGSPPEKRHGCGKKDPRVRQLEQERQVLGSAANSDVSRDERNEKGCDKNQA